MNKTIRLRSNNHFLLDYIDKLPSHCLTSKCNYSLEKKGTYKELQN